MKKRLSAEEHIAYAAKFRQLRTDIVSAAFELAPHLPKSHPARRKFSQVIALMQTVAHELDVEYHLVADDKTFAKHGHVYYSNALIEPD